MTPRQPQTFLRGNSRNLSSHPKFLLHVIPGAFAILGVAAAVVNMSSFRQILRTNGQNAPSRASSLFVSAHGRSAAFRRLSSSSVSSRTSHEARLASPPSSLLGPAPLRSRLLLDAILIESVTRVGARPLHFSARIAQQQSPKDQEPAPKEAKPSDVESEQKESSSAEEQTAKKEDGEAKGNKDEGEKDGEKGEKEGEKEEKKEDLPPPPPHGDKTPWQVFMETMSSELKQSKEWNESTKALASSAHQFSESESVRKARQAYDATTGAVSNTASTVVKTTAGAIGKGAAWTWETPVMKGVRKGATITGDALDKATKPIRETEAFKNVKDVIDDGSSSRYGGWVDKEERKRRRELKEQQDLESGKSSEVHQEDPE